MPWSLAISFLGLNYIFSVQVWNICLNLIDFSKKESTFCLFKTEFKAKKLFARNLGIQLRRAVHIHMTKPLAKKVSFFLSHNRTIVWRKMPIFFSSLNQLQHSSSVENEDIYCDRLNEYLLHKGTILWLQMF